MECSYQYSSKTPVRTMVRACIPGARSLLCSLRACSHRNALPLWQPCVPHACHMRHKNMTHTPIGTKWRQGPIAKRRPECPKVSVRRARGAPGRARPTRRPGGARAAQTRAPQTSPRSPPGRRHPARAGAGRPTRTWPPGTQQCQVMHPRALRPAFFPSCASIGQIRPYDFRCIPRIIMPAGSGPT